MSAIWIVSPHNSKSWIELYLLYSIAPCIKITSVNGISSTHLSKFTAYCSIANPLERTTERTESPPINNLSFQDLTSFKNLLLALHALNNQDIWSELCHKELLHLAYFDNDEELYQWKVAVIKKSPDTWVKTPDPYWVRTFLCFISLLSWIIICWAIN